MKSNPLVMPFLFILASFSIIYLISDNIDVVYGGVFLCSILLIIHKLYNYFQTTIVLNQGNEVHQIVFERGKDGVIVTDKQGMITKANHQVLDLFGYTPAQLIGENISILIPDEPAKKHNLYIQAVTEDLNLKQVDLTQDRSVYGKLSNGQIIPLSINITKISTGYVSILNDLSLQKNAIKYFQENTVTQLLMESMKSVAFWEWDIDTNSVKWSSEMNGFLGLDSSEDPTYDNFMRYVHPSDKTLLETALNNAVENGADYDVEHRLLRSDGSTLWVNHKGVYVDSEYIESRKMSGITIDITKQKSLEEKLNAAEVQSAQAQKTKLNFLARISHDLRNPLNAIMGFATILHENRELDAQTKEHIGIIGQNANILNKLVVDMVDLSRIELDNVHTNTENINVRRMFKEVLADLRPSIEHKSMIIDNQINRETEIQINRIRIKQIFLNMIHTLIKFNVEHSKIRVADENNGRDYIIKFIDTNDELGKSDLEKIFDPFNHLISDGRSYEIETIGLELAIVKATVEKLGGKIYIEQNPNFGNTICMIFPLDKLNNYEIIRDDKTLDILYIEDSIRNVKNMENIVSKFTNVKLTSSYSSDYGLSLLRVNEYEMIYVDLDLPVFNGYQIYDIIRSMAHLKDTKVYAVSNNSSHEEIEKCLAYGFDDHLKKPLDPDFIKLQIVKNTKSLTTLL